MPLLASCSRRCCWSRWRWASGWWAAPRGPTPRRSRRTLLAEARDRADLLARELNHRVKNLFAVILAIVQMSGKDAPEAKPVVDSIADRIHALLTAHEVTQGAADRSRCVAADTDRDRDPALSVSERQGRARRAGRDPRRHGR